MNRPDPLTPTCIVVHEPHLEVTCLSFPNPSPLRHAHRRPVRVARFPLAPGPDNATSHSSIGRRPSPYSHTAFGAKPAAPVHPPAIGHYRACRCRAEPLADPTAVGELVGYARTTSTITPRKLTSKEVINRRC
jgi:hypothetical protein